MDHVRDAAGLGSTRGAVQWSMVDVGFDCVDVGH